MQAEDLGDTLAKKSEIVRPRREAANINGPQIHGGLSLSHPLSEIFSRAARAGNAHRVEAGGNEQPFQLWRFAHDEVVVRRKALRPVDEFRKLGRLQRWNPVLPVLERLGEFPPVRIEQLKGKLVR